MHIKESKYMKRTGTRASGVGVGSGGKQFVELREAGVSDRAIRLLEELMTGGVAFDPALSRAIMVTDLDLFHAIDAVKGANSTLGFYGKVRNYLRDRNVKARL